MSFVAREVKTVVKLQIAGGKATPAPPIGPALGQHVGWVIPVIITVYDDRSFKFVTKTPPASDLLKKAAGVQKGAGNSKKETVGTITRAKLLELAALKLPDLNANDVEAASRILEGSARNMGIKVID